MEAQKGDNKVNKFGEWHDALYKAILAARLGRGVLLKYIGRLEKIERKFQAGLVSEADKESEKVIFDYLRKNFPEDEFLGEESADSHTKVETPKTGQRGRWIVDPLDGTTNYVHQFPVFCVSIGYEFAGRSNCGHRCADARRSLHRGSQSQPISMVSRCMSVAPPSTGRFFVLDF